jgi:hypothetical protein
MNTHTPCRILGIDGTLSARFPETPNAQALWVWEGVLDASTAAALMRGMLRDAGVVGFAHGAPHRLALQRMWFDAERGRSLIAFAGPPVPGVVEG